jgi:hypothetical protein
MSRPWFAIIWFAVWGLFQAFAVVSILIGTWRKPEAFPEEAYFSLIYPDMFFIPLYLLASALLMARHRFGVVCGLFAAGGIGYVMIYLLALSGLKGALNLVADGVFLFCTLLAVWQLSTRLMSQATA